MADMIVLADFAETASDFARENKQEIFSAAIGPGLAGIPDTPVKPLDDYAITLNTIDEVSLTELFVGSVVQPSKYNGFTPKDDVATLKPRIAKVKPCKVDLQMTQKQIMTMYKSYLSRVANRKVDMTTYPFEQFIIEKVMEKASQDLRNGYVNGERDDDGTTYLDAMDGLFKKYTEFVADGDTPAGNIASISAITDSNGVAQFEKILDVLPLEYFYQDLVCLTPLKHLKSYERDYRSKYGTLPYNNGFQKQVIEGSQIEFIVEPYMLTTGATAFEAPIITPRENIAWLYDDASALTNLEFDYEKRSRSLAYVMDFQVAMDVCLPKLLFSGNVA